MTIGNRYMFFVSDRSEGAWYFRALGFGVQVKAPWSWKPYSEREGYRRFWPRNGWRMRFLYPGDNPLDAK
jgi:hypothetical protein